MINNRIYKLNRKSRYVKIYKEPSPTVPDDSYTIKEILTKFTRGVDPMLTKLADYDSEEHDPENLDDTQFELNPIRTIEDLSDITELNYFLEQTEKNKAIIEKRIAEQKAANAKKLASEQ
jgi:hypothetical protein